MNNSIFTVSGQAVDILDPDPNSIRINDIAHGLSNICRFNGQIPYFYSVAMHSYYVSYLLELEGKSSLIQLLGLLHDCSENYLMDAHRPLKHIIKSVYSPIEDKFQKLILKKFANWEEDLPEVVRWADDTILTTEMRDITSVPLYKWTYSLPPTNRFSIAPDGNSNTNNESTKELFLDRYYSLSASVKFRRKSKW